MPRNKRFDLKDVTQLVVQTAPSGVRVMEGEEDFSAMRRAMQIGAECSGTDIHAYSFGPGQIVMLVTPREERGVSRLMQSLGKRYVVHFNNRGGNVKRLWASRHRVTPIENDKFFLVTSHLVERVHLGSHVSPADTPAWRTSFHENSGERPLQILTPHSLYQALGSSRTERTSVYRMQSENVDWRRYREKIRDVLAGKGHLATPRYVRQMERRSGTRLLPRKPGRPVAQQGDALLGSSPVPG